MRVPVVSLPFTFAPSVPPFVHVPQCTDSTGVEVVSDPTDESVHSTKVVRYFLSCTKFQEVDLFFFFFFTQTTEEGQRAEGMTSKVELKSTTSTSPSFQWTG